MMHLAGYPKILANAPAGPLIGMVITARRALCGASYPAVTAADSAGGLPTSGQAALRLPPAQVARAADLCEAPATEVGVSAGAELAGRRDDRDCCHAGTTAGICRPPPPHAWCRRDRCRRVANNLPVGLPEIYVGCARYWSALTTPGISRSPERSLSTATRLSGAATQTGLLPMTGKGVTASDAWDLSKKVRDGDAWNWMPELTRFPWSAVGLCRVQEPCGKRSISSKTPRTRFSAPRSEPRHGARCPPSAGRTRARARA